MKETKVIAIRVDKEKYDLLKKDQELLGYTDLSKYLKMRLVIDNPPKIKFSKSKHDQEIIELLAFSELFPYAVIENIKTALSKVKSEKKKDGYSKLLKRYSVGYNILRQTNSIFLNAIDEQAERLQYGIDIVEAFTDFITNYSKSKSKIKELKKFCRR